MWETRNGGIPKSSILYNWIFHYKPTILNMNLPFGDGLGWLYLGIPSHRWCGHPLCVNQVWPVTHIMCTYNIYIVLCYVLNIHIILTYAKHVYIYIQHKLYCLIYIYIYYVLVLIDIQMLWHVTFVVGLVFLFYRHCLDMITMTSMIGMIALFVVIFFTPPKSEFRIDPATIYVQC